MSLQFLTGLDPNGVIKTPSVVGKSNGRNTYLVTRQVIDTAYVLPVYVFNGPNPVGNAILAIPALAANYFYKVTQISAWWSGGAGNAFSIRYTYNANPTRLKFNNALVANDVLGWDGELWLLATTTIEFNVNVTGANMNLWLSVNMTRYDVNQV